MIFRTRVIVGLDIGHHSIKMAVMSRNRREILDLIEEPVLPTRQYLDDVVDAHALEAVVQQVLRTWTTRPRTDCSLAVSVQGDGAVGALLDLPPLDRKLLDAAIEGAAERLVPYPRNEGALGVVPVTLVQGADKRTSWFVSVVRSQALENIRACVQSSGQALDKAEINVFPLVRGAVANRPGGDGDVTGLLCVGARVTTLVALRGDAPVALRSFRFGSADFTYAHHMTLQGTWAEAERAFFTSRATDREIAVEPSLGRWLDQIRKSVDTWSRSGGPGRPEKLLLTGGGAAWKGLDVRLAEHVGIPVELDEWRNLKPPRGREGLFLGIFGTAVGLCLP